MVSTWVATLVLFILFVSTSREGPKKRGDGDSDSDSDSDSEAATSSPTPTSFGFLTSSVPARRRLLVLQSARFVLLRLRRRLLRILCDDDCEFFNSPRFFSGLQVFAVGSSS